MAMKLKLPLKKSEKEFKDTAEVTVETMPPAKYGFLQLGVLLVLLGGIAIFVTGFLFQSQAVSTVADSREREMQLTADNLAASVADMVQQRSEKMDLLVRDPEIISIAERGAYEELQGKEAELAYLFPKAVRVRILPPGLDEVDMNASPPISYAALDMLREAETKEAPPPAEVHLSNTPQQHINLVRRILDTSGRRIVGHLMVSLPVTLLQTAIDSAKNARGYGEIWQTINNNPVTLAKRGSHGLRDGDPLVTVNVSGSRWQVAYWGEQGGVAGDPIGLVIVAGSAIALFTLAVFLLLRWYVAMLKNDQTTIFSAVRDGQSGRMKKDYRLQLKENRSAIVAVLRLFGSGDAKRAAVAAAAGGGADPLQAGLAPVPAAPAKSKAPVIPDSASDFGVLDDSAMAAPEQDDGLDSHLLDMTPSGTSAGPDPSIFRAYDIRGVVGKTLTPEVVFQIGKAVGSEALALGEQSVIVGRDGRLSGPDLSDELIRGLRASGVNVKDIGMVPTPVLYFATHHLDTQSGVMVTGSHNPPDYNGFKIVIAGQTLSGDAIQGLRNRIEAQRFSEGKGELEAVDVIDDYIARITKDVTVSRPMKVVIDCGNGVAGAVAPRLFEALGCTVTQLFCDVDGSFPNHHPDPAKPENLATLIDIVTAQGADIGIAFDGDGDRLGVIDSDGNIIWPDRLLMLLAMDVLSRNPGADIIYDVKCSSHLAKIIRDFGGSPEMWRTGHSMIKARIKETGALLAGEMSGHIFFSERWYGFDDALYSAARLIEILADDHRASASVFGVLPDGVNTPELTIPLEEGQPEGIMASFLGTANFPGADISTIDGLRADFPNGWGLVRASNTTPSLVLRFEGNDADALAEIQNLFRDALLSADPSLKLPF